MAQVEILIDHFPWLAESAQRYLSERSGENTQTSFLRGNKTIEVLNQHLPELGYKPRILLVGLGLADPIVCCYEPFRVAAHLEGRGVDFEMDLVDIREEVIRDVEERETLFYCSDGHQRQAVINFDRAWKKYLADTHLGDHKVCEEEQGLKFAKYVRKGSNIYSPDRYFKAGIRAAPVSRVFRQKLASGEIKLIHADIAKADLSLLFHDYAEFINVSYLLPPEGQKLALANITLSLKVGGYLLLDGLFLNSSLSLFSERGGWLDTKTLGKLGLVVAQVIEDDEESKTVLLLKTKEI